MYIALKTKKILTKKTQKMFLKWNEHPIYFIIWELPCDYYEGYDLVCK